ncbi:tyrosine-type recombinase/integrase [Desulfoscipio gibsoniae]
MRKISIFKHGVKSIKDEELANSLDLNDAVSQFKMRCIAKNLSKKTTKWYIEQITLFKEWLKDKEYSTTISQITGEILLQYVLYLTMEKKNHTGNNLSPATINSHRRALSAFFNFLYNRGLIKNSPMKYVEKQKEPHYTIRPLSEKQIKALLSLPDMRTFHGYRDYVLKIS